MSAHRLAATPPRSLPDRNVHEPVALALLAGVGVASALWALYLWEHLVLARAGWSALCATGEQAACAAAWDSPFAFTVHRLTGMPLAGWGLTWSIAAFVFPLIGLLRLAQRRAVSPLLWASRWLAVSGGMAVLLLGLISFFERAICPDCLVSYLLIFLYLVVTLTIWDQMSMGDARRGLVLAAGACGGVFLLLLGPGLRTPRSSVDGAGGGLSYSSSPGTGDPKRDQQLARFVAALSPEDRQTLSDSLYVYRSSGLAPVASRETGQPAQTAAPVKITTFTDVFCPECGLVEETLESLRRQLPPGSFSVERRYYPLASECNPRALVRHGKSVHCFAAVAQICLEDDAGASFSRELLRPRSSLTEEDIYELAAPYATRSELSRCVGSQETQARLKEDLALADRHRIRRAPLVLIDGRRGTTFGPFLYAMVLTGGAASHPAFATLPEPQPRADFR